MSQLLLRLERELHAESDPAFRAELGARIAAALARLGRFVEARQRIEQLRKDFGDGKSGRATVWIMLAEGVVHLYENFSPVALDRITRAQFLGIAMAYPAMVANASAWKAHIEFENSKFSDMVKSLNLAVANAGQTDHDAQTRLSIVVSNAFMTCGNRVEAQKWFMRGRDHAVKNGDRASVEAMLYNRAAFGLAWLRAEKCIRDFDPAALVSARMEIDSAKNLQELTGIAAMKSHILLWESRLQILEGQYGRAIESLRSIREESTFAKYNFSQALIDLEIGFCLFNSGQSEEALRVAQPVLENTMNELDVDEQMVAAWMRWQLATLDVRFGDPALHFDRLEALRSQYELSRVELESSLNGFTG